MTCGGSKSATTGLFIYSIDDTQSIVEIRVIRHRKDAYGPT